MDGQYAVPQRPLMHSVALVETISLPMSRITLFLAMCALAPLCRGQFSEAQLLYRSPAYHALSQCTADLNGDGHRDMLVGSGRGVYWCAGDGNGGLGTPVALLADPGEEYVATAADADGDGDVDVAYAAHTHGRAYLLLNSGGGTFSAPIELTTSGAPFLGLRFADLDGDGDADLVTGRTDGLHRFQNSGNAQFLADEHLVADSMAYPTFDVGDLNADGFPDLAMASDQNYLLTFHLNDGSGAFPVEDTLVPGDNNSRALCMADADADGDLDVFLLSNTMWNVRLFRNNGDGTFPAFGEYALENFQQPGTMFLGDADGDGDADMLLSSDNAGELVLQTNDGSGLTWTQTLVSSYLTDMRSLGMADMDEDGTPDVLYANYGTGQSGIMLAQGTNYTMGAAMGAAVGKVQRVYTADLNGDGHPDVAGSSSEPDGVVIGLSDGAGGIAEFYPLPYTSPFGTSTLAFADVDNDGDIDLFRTGAFDAAIGLYRNDGTGHFPQHSTFGTAEPDKLATGDLDGDGDQDLAYVGQGVVTVGMYRNNGTGTAWTPTNLENNSSLPSANGVAIKDLDGDGDMDIAVHSNDYAGGGHMYQLLNTGSWSGYPYPDPFIFMPYIAYYVDMDFGDIDGDGDLDVLGAQDYDAALSWSMNTGGANFQAVGGIEQYTSYELRSAALMDVNGDGDLDAVALRRPFTGPCLLSYYDNDGTGGFAPAISTPTNVNGVEWMEPFDFDGDGDQDVLIGSVDGQGIFWMENFYGSPYHVNGRLFYDIDGDGASDANEPGFPFAHVTLAPSSGSVLTQPDGAYSIACDAGNHAVSADVDPALWQVTTPPSYNVTVDDVQPTSTGNDFGFLPAADNTQASVWSTSTSTLCNSGSILWAGVTNQGNSILHGTFSLTLDPLFTYSAAIPAPDLVVGNTYQWTIDSLFFFDHWTAQLFVISPSVNNIGDTVHVSGIFHSVDGNGVPTGDFTDDHASVVTCAYDPNTKQVEPRGTGPQGLLDVADAPLEYTVHFQNTGTAPAANVRISDTLSTLLDANSLTVLGASHALTSVTIGTDNEVIFRFDGIQLPDSNTNEPASHGFVRFSVRPIGGLASGSVVHNHAGIHFDLNPPVITDTTTTTFFDCANYVPVITEPSVALLDAGPGVSFQWFKNGEAIPGATDQQLLTTTTAWYSVQVTNVFGCTAMSAGYEVLFQAIPETGRNPGLTAWPVPATDQVHLISATPLASTDRIDLIDVNGRILGTYNGTGSRTFMLERKDLPAGLYTVRLLRAERIDAVRVVWR